MSAGSFVFVNSGIVLALSADRDKLLHAEVIHFPGEFPKRKVEAAEFCSVGNSSRETQLGCHPPAEFMGRP